MFYIGKKVGHTAPSHDVLPHHMFGDPATNRIKDLDMLWRKFSFMSKSRSQCQT